MTTELPPPPVAEPPTSVDERPPPSRAELLALELAALTRGTTRGHEQGHAQGHAQGLTQGIVALCDVLEIPLDADRLTTLEHLDSPHLQALLDAIRSARRWP